MQYANNLIVSPRVRTVLTSLLATAVDRDVPSRLSKLVSLPRSERGEGRWVKLVFVTRSTMYYVMLGTHSLWRGLHWRHDIYDMFMCAVQGQVQRIAAMGFMICTLYKQLMG
jgi:hypothetical protein